MIMDSFSPMVPGGAMRVGILSTAGVLRALCGVAGGSSKASLSAHFAKWGNLAELNAVSALCVFAGATSNAIHRKTLRKRRSSLSLACL